MSEGGLIAAVVALALGLLIWACVADSKAMAAKQRTFMQACAADGRKPYDCEMQWQAYETAHNAEIAASAAIGVAAGSAGRR